MAKTLSLIRIPLSDSLVGGTYHSFVINEIIKDYAKGDSVEIYKDLSKIQPKFEDLQSLVAAGGYFENILLGIELTAAGAQRDVPASIPGSTYTDENEQPQTRTWAQWVRSQPGLRAIKKVDENLYVIKAIVDKEMMNSDQLTAAHAQAGINILEWSIVKFRAASEDWEEFEL